MSTLWNMWKFPTLQPYPNIDQVFHQLHLTEFNMCSTCDTGSLHETRWLGVNNIVWQKHVPNLYIYTFISMFLIDKTNTKQYRIKILTKLTCFHCSSSTVTMCTVTAILVWREVSKSSVAIGPTYASVCSQPTFYPISQVMREWSQPIRQCHICLLLLAETYLTQYIENVTMSQLSDDRPNGLVMFCGVDIRAESQSGLYKLQSRHKSGYVALGLSVIQSHFRL